MPVASENVVGRLVVCKPALQRGLLWIAWLLLLLYIGLEVVFVNVGVDQTDAMAQLLDGSAQLSDGLNLLLEKSGDLTEGVRQLADGATKLTDGAAQLNEGAGKLQGGIHPRPQRLAGDHKSRGQQASGLQGSPKEEVRI